MKWLKMKSGSVTYSVGIGGIIINYGVSQFHILTAYAKRAFVQAMWNMVNRTCSNAERQQGDLRPCKQPKANGQSFPKFGLSITA